MGSLIGREVRGQRATHNTRSNLPAWAKKSIHGTFRAAANPETAQLSLVCCRQM